MSATELCQLFFLLRKGPREDPARPKEKGGLGGVVGYGWASACVGRSPKDQGHQPETNKDIIVADGHTVSNAPEISSDLRSKAAQGPASTGVGGRPGRPQGAVSFSRRNLFS